jgi:polyhydroxyalkanoate synthesis regulator phasin
MKTAANTIAMIDRMNARREQMLRELQSDMADLVAAGEMTAEQANEWVNSAADRWNAES